MARKHQRTPRTHNKEVLKKQGSHNKEVSKTIRNAQQGGVEGTNSAQ